MNIKSFIIAVAAAASLMSFAATDVNSPILPGWGKYYWNTHSKWYIHPPAFDFKAVTGATAYRFRVVADGTATNVFTAATSTADLAPVWTKLPKKGVVEVVCEGTDASGKALGVAGTAKFWKNAPFDPKACEPAVRLYAETAAKTYDYIFALPAQKRLAETGKPDFTYAHNCYPTKMNVAIVNAAVGAAENDPSKKGGMMKLARAAADYLIATAEPAGTPLAYFTQTYEKGNDNLTAKAYQGQHMLIYPATAASAFVRLYRACGERKYLETAERIAATYLKLQGEDGTWFLKMWAKDGTSVTPNRLFPMTVCSMLETLYAETKKSEYRAAADRAFAFIEKGPLADWNWEGQFEDVKPTARYVNLTKHSAVDTAMYLLKRYPGDAKRVAQARALMDFSEDQFVAWEKPCRADGVSYPDYHPTQAVTNWWCFPTVMEQYHWYVPTDASVAKMIRGYLAIHAVSKDPVDFAKAKALGDALTRAQRENGRIPTQWMGEWYKPGVGGDWINCMIASANALAQLAKETSGDAAQKPQPATYYVSKGETGTASETGVVSGKTAVRRRVAFLGGSITAMTEGYRPRVSAWLRKTYPNVRFDVTSAGISSTCSDTGAFRLKEHVLDPGVPDLLIFEYAVNDDQDGHFTRAHMIRGMEGIVRHLRKANPAAEMVIVLFVNDRQIEEIRRGVEPLTYSTHRAVAAHYGIPVADIGGALFASERAGTYGWKEYGSCHPSPEGCELAARTIEEVLKNSWSPYRLPAAKPLLEPMDPNCYDCGGTLSLETVRLDAGWNLSLPDWSKVEGFKRPLYVQKPILWSETAGAEMRIAFEGRALGAFLTAGPDAGALDVSVDGGPFVRHDLYTSYSSGLNYPYTRILADGLAAGRHEVVVRVAAESNPASKGHAVRINRLVVNGNR